MPEGMKPSKYQSKIYRWVKAGEGSAIIAATAGSGKTSTIVEAAKLLPESDSIAFVAFNKSIAEELKRRLPKHVRSCTLNSLGYGAWIKTCGGKPPQVDSNKVRSIIDDHVSYADQKIYGQAVKKLVGLAKAHGLVPQSEEQGATSLMFDTEENWMQLITTYSVEPERDGTVRRLIELARLTLAESIRTAQQIIDFDDQIYMPVILRSRFWQYDVVFVDEAQDVSPIQRAMLKLSLKAGGRLIAVGDACQAIYGFRGADSDSISKIKQEFSAIELPLSVSYRCPQAVVKEAQKFVPEIESAETAPEGKVSAMSAFDDATFEPTDGIVCRNTAPLVELAYKLIRRGKGCRILGREIGQGLITLINKMNASGIDDLEARLDAYMQREQQKMMAKGQEDKAGAMNDKVDTIRILCSELPEDKRTIDMLIEMIGSLFTDNNTGLLTLSTVHKAKGLEFNRVFILNPSLMPSKWARQAWQQQQERNLQYVAVTRAKQELVYIELVNYKERVKAQKEVA